MTSAVSEIVLAPNEKRCSKCKEVKGRSEFGINTKGNKKFLRSNCKICGSLSNKLNNSNNRLAADPQALKCPYCPFWFTNLVAHTIKIHNKNKEDLVLCGIGDVLSPQVHNNMSKGRKGIPRPDLRVGDIAEIKPGRITFPEEYWPHDCKYARCVIDRKERRLLFNPINKRSPGVKAICKSGSGSYRLRTRVYHGLLDVVKTTMGREAIEFRKGGRAGFYIQFKEGDDYLLDMFEFWVKSPKSIQNTSPLSIQIGKKPVITIADHIWPINAEYAYLEYNFYGVRSVKWCLDILPVSRTGFIVGANKLNFKQYLGLEDCYKVRLNSKRFQIYPTTFLKFNNIFPGDWRLKEVLSSGALRFVSSEKTGRKPQPMQTPDGTFEDWLTEIGENDSQPKEQSEDIAS